MEERYRDAADDRDEVALTRKNLDPRSLGQVGQIHRSPIADERGALVIHGHVGELRKQRSRMNKFIIRASLLGDTSQFLHLAGRGQGELGERGPARREAL